MAANEPSSAVRSATSTSAIASASTTACAGSDDAAPAAIAAGTAGTIRVGIGGWNYVPWRETFYPPGLAQSRELEYAASRLTAIEINATYYGTQKRASFAKWRDATPEGFAFSVKASRFATNRRILAEAGESIERFVGSGIAELGAKLGPLVWQFATTKAFDADDFGAFLSLLPKQSEGVALRHVMDVRHPSFASEAYLALARRHGVATVFTDSDDYPSFADLTAGFVYARLMRTSTECLTGYPEQQLSAWASRARAWAGGGEPASLPRVTAPELPSTMPRDVFLFFISGAKERAPAAAMGTLGALRNPMPSSIAPL